MSSDAAEVLSLDGREVRVTHPDKPYFSKGTKLSKLDLVRYYLAVAEGAIPSEHIRAELSDVVTGVHPGRSSLDEITIFKSLGLAIEDLAAAAYVYQKAADQGLGNRIDF